MLTVEQWINRLKTLNQKAEICISVQGLHWWANGFLEFHSDHTSHETAEKVGLYIVKMHPQ